MKRNMYKTYMIEELKESRDEFGNVQVIMNNYGIKFNVVFLGNSIGIIACMVEKCSDCDKYLKKKGYNEMGEA